MKGVPIITNFKLTMKLYELKIYENDVKLLKFKGSPAQVDL